jgi:hypothetical protein
VVQESSALILLVGLGGKYLGSAHQQFAGGFAARGGYLILIKAAFHQLGDE